ncbi:MAG: SDR family NAD(P)-dependent oxidoreductase, partial [Leptospiraceae bacterium]|nr:SDR family NAD(P)-dependent oxidoreductase [Leptospiraceae bacterium]
INNAGALFNEKELTSEGFEKSFALLLLGPYIFTTLLFPLLKNSENGARIINVSSGGMYGSRLEVQHLNSTDDYNGTIAYSRAKRGLVAISEFWAESLKKDNIASFSMHPGWTDTEAVKSSLPGFYNLTKDILRNTKEGADTINWLASAEELNKKTGGFYLDRKLQPQHIFFTEHSPEEVKNLVDFLENCGEKFLKIS